MWRWRKKKLTDEEANALLHLLSDHFHQPVMPLRRFCDAMTTWMRCIEQNNADSELDGAWRQGSDYYKHLEQIWVDIRKSNLLARLLLGGEKLRTKKCPVHQGHWHGGFGHCEHQCEGTGFLREQEDTDKRR